MTQKFVEDANADLLDSLDRTFADVSVALVRLPQMVDAIIQETIVKGIKRNSVALLGADKPDENASDIRIGNLRCYVQCGVDLERRANLKIAILARTPDPEIANAKTRSVWIRWKLFGTYSSASVSIPAYFARADTELVEAYVLGLFSVGYTWLIDQILLEVSKMGEQASRQLYEFIRRVAPHPKHLEGFVFGAANSRGDFQILHESSVLTLVELASKAASNMRLSAIEIALHVASEIVPLSDSPVKAVAQKGSPVELDLAADAYYRQDSNLNASLRSVWGKTLCCFPIVSEEPLLILAFYPGATKSLMEPILSAHKERLAAIARQNSSKIELNLAISEMIRDELKHENNSSKPPGRIRKNLEFGAHLVGIVMGEIVKHPH